MATVETRIGRLRTDRWRWLLSASRIALLASIGWFLLARWANVSLDVRTQAGIYLFGMVVLNLPYGGYEHMSNLRSRGLPFGARYIGLYLLAAAAFVALFFAAPVVGLAVAIAVAVIKGGHGGLRVLDALVGTDHLRTGPQRALAAFVRGGTVMIVPMYAWPGDFAAFSTFMIDIFQPGAFAAVAPHFPTVRSLWGGVFAVAVGAHVALGFARREGLSTWLVDVGETALLIAYFAVVPVLVAVGLYFPLWYSLRQSARAEAIKNEHPADPGSAPSPGAVVAAFVGGTVATFGLAALLATLAPNPLSGGTPLVSGVAFFSVFISIVALPHVVVGDWLDADRGIWYTP
ncbi:Brp/Blh family beta-carotene 15,15'-dioxygenase [Natronomonas sp.]|uniref:Brp/Blh family beta-carotene 15,15'-dioxygenase n=1 Tax=Natronomonas sp. TaxID=2184060 RepID=UPI002613C585|nr:Brp/Blh family beta-carotene 15,15'-dioxygenase [Natronomonas sp.]